MYDNSSAVADWSNASDVSPLWLGGIRQEFMAWLPHGIVGPKVHGFIDQEDGLVLEEDADCLRVQIGEKHWLPWARYGEDCPVEVTIQLNRETCCARSLTHVIAELRPLANAPSEAMQRRLFRILRALRYCLLAQELEVV